MSVKVSSDAALVLLGLLNHASLTAGDKEDLLNIMGENPTPQSVNEAIEEANELIQLKS